MKAAAVLFMEDGVTKTGIDAIIARAGVAKATLYHHFPSKDDLVVAWLEDPPTNWFRRLRSDAERRSKSPEKRMLSFFDEMGEWFVESDFRGCPFLNTAVEIADPSHRARKPLLDLTHEVESFFLDNAREAGISNPAALAAKIWLLVPGAIMAAVARQQPDPARVAKEAARVLMKSARSDRS